MRSSNYGYRLASRRIKLVEAMLCEVVDSCVSAEQAFAGKQSAFILTDSLQIILAVGVNHVPGLDPQRLDNESGVPGIRSRYVH